MNKIIIKRALLLGVFFLCTLSAASIILMKNPFLGLSKINLGMDLKGGTQITLSVDKEDIREIEYKNIISFVLGIDEGAVISEKSDERIIFNLSENSNASDLALEINNGFDDLMASKAGSNLVISGLRNYVSYAASRAIKDNLNVIEKRFNAMGTSDISVYQVGTDKINIEFSDIDNSEKIKDVITSSSEIGIYLSHKGGVKLMNEGFEVERAFTPFLTGHDVHEAVSSIDHQTGFPVVSITLNSAAGKIMNDISSKNIGKPIIITEKSRVKIDNGYQDLEEVVSYARVASVLDRRFNINGMETTEKADILALVLKSGALSAPMHVQSERVISSKMGSKNIDMALKSVLIGVILLFSYIIYSYRLRGLFACLTLILNASLCILIMGFMGFSLTLTGIAGIILTLGMAVDANILILEREKELEFLSLNKVRDSFNQSFTAISDSNITTFIMAMVLYNVGSTSLKGFAVTIGIGVITTMLSSFYFNKSFFVTESK